jgi:hypothetical protein
LEIVGEASAVTVRVAVLLFDPAVGVWVVVTPPAVFMFGPTVVAATVTVTVQLPAGMVIPVNWAKSWPFVSVLGVVPTQVPPTGPATVDIPEGKLSLNAPPVKALALELLNVKVMVVEPPCTIVVGLKPLVIVGADRTVRLAVLLAAPAVGVCVVITPVVLLGWTPGVKLSTTKVTVQLLLAGIVIPEKLMAPV